MLDQHLAFFGAQNIPVLCWMASPDGAVHWYNQSWYDYTGQTPTQADGWGWREVYEPEALPGVLIRLTSNLRRKQPFRIVGRLRGADNVFRPFITRMRPALRDGEVLSWFGSSSEASDLLAEDAELRAELESLGGRQC